MEGADEKMLELSDLYLKAANLEGVERQRVLLNKLGIYEKLGRKGEVDKTLKEIIATDPNTPQGKLATQRLKELGSDSKKEN